MLRRRGHPARASVLRAARANRRTSARPGESTSNKCTADLRIELQLDYVHMGRGRLLWRGGTQGALSASPIGAALSRPAETQAGRRVSLRHTQLEGTCRACTTYSRLASTRSVASSRRRADGRHGLRRRDITAAGAAGCPSAVSHRNPHRRRQTPPRDSAGSAFAALIPIPATEGAPCPAHAQHRMPPPVIRSSLNPVAYDALSVHLVRPGPTRPCLCHRWSTWWCRTPTMSGLTPTRVWPIGARRWVSVRRGAD
jgi:hypothetical protein